MTGSSAPSSAPFEGLFRDSAESAYGADGFHHRHAASADGMVGVAEAFRAQGFFLEMIAGEDRRADLQAMRLAYTFNRYGAPDRHLVIVDLPGEIPGAEAPSVAGVFPAADWFEREVFDMYGVRFAGHPNLKRILLPDDADFHALLKDFGRIEDASDDGPDAAPKGAE